MEVKLDQEKLEAAIIRQAVDQIYGDDDRIYERVRQEVEQRVSKAIEIGLAGEIEKAINSIMEKALDTEVTPTNIWGEREGKPTTIRAALHERAKDFWQEKVNDKGEKSTYGGKPRYEYVLSLVAANEFGTQIKQNAASIAGAIKDSVREGFYKQVDEKLNEFFKISSLDDQKRAATAKNLPF